MSDIAEVAARGDRRASLEALRDVLASELDGPGHTTDCECTCGITARDARVIAAVSKEFRAVVDALEAMPQAEGADPLDAIAGNVEDELAPRRENRRAGPSAPKRP